MAEFQVTEGTGTYIKAEGAGTTGDGYRAKHSVDDGDDAALGATTDAAATAGSTGTLHAKQRLMTTLLDAINTALADVSTQTTLAALLTELQAKADLAETQPVSLASVPSHAVTNAGTFAVQADSVDGIAAEAAALGNGVLIQGDDGTDRKNINVDATTGDVQVDITHTVTVDGSGVTQPVSGTVTANLGTIADVATQTTLASLLTELQAKADLAETQPVSAASLPLPTGAATQTTLASLLTELQAKADVTETQPVSAASLPLPSGASTAANQSTGNTSLSNITTAVQLIDNSIVAHDAAITGATGLNAIGLNARSTSATAVGDGDAVRALATLLGKQVTHPHALPANLWQYAGTTAITNTTPVAVKAAGAAGIRNYVTSVTVLNSHATVGTTVEIRDATTAMHVGYAAAAGGGYTITFPTPLRGTAATAVNAYCGTTGANVYVSASGYVAAE